MAAFFRKPVEDRHLLAWAAVLHTAVAIGLRLVPFAALCRALARVGSRRLRARAGQMPDARIVWAVETAAALLPGATCLSRALAAQCLLARHGRVAALCYGVARPAAAGGRPLAHAWLERAGRTVVGGETPHVYHTLVHAEVP